MSKMPRPNCLPGQKPLFNGLVLEPAPAAPEIAPEGDHTKTSGRLPVGKLKKARNTRSAAPQAHKTQSFLKFPDA